MWEEEDFCAAPAAHAEGEDFSAPSRPSRAGPGTGQAGRPRDPPCEGEFGAFVLWDALQAATSSLARVVGGVARMRWRVELSAAAPEPDVAGAPIAGPRGRGAAPWGHLVYEVLDVDWFDQCTLVGDGVELNSAASGARLTQLCANVMVCGEVTVPEFLDYVSDDITYSRGFVVTTADVRILEDNVLPHCVQRLPLGLRLAPKDVVLNSPPMSVLRSWKHRAGVRRMPTATAPAAPESLPHQPRESARLLAMPPKRHIETETEIVDGPRKRRFGIEKDPMRMVNAVAFAMHLRQVAEFSEAMAAAKRVDAPDVSDDDAESEERDATNDPKRRQIDIAKAKVDIVGMLLERRQWDQEMTDDSVLGINCYSDSSPTTGIEIQGMAVDVFKKDNSVRRVMLPGATMKYGHFDAINTAMAFLWAVWLLFGPTNAHMAYFCSHVRSFTTDAGVERGTIDICDVLDAFMAYIGGKTLEEVRHLVRFGYRLWPRCLRIIGWNHSVSSVLKSVCKYDPNWPSILDSLRALCRFLAMRHGGTILQADCRGSCRA